MGNDAADGKLISEGIFVFSCLLVSVGWINDTCVHHRIKANRLEFDVLAVTHLHITSATGKFRPLEQQKQDFQRVLSSPLS